MKRFVIVFVCCSLVACTSFQPVNDSSGNIQKGIVAGELIAVGDRIRLTTSDNVVHKFRIESIDANEIMGQSISIPISQVVALEKKRLAVARTVGLSIGIILLIAIRDADPAFFPDPPQ